MKSSKNKSTLIYFALCLLFTSNNFYGQDGVLDTSFGSNGIETTDINNLYEVFSAMTVQDDGKIIVVGNNSSGSTANNESIIVRYNADGGLDTTFGTNGIIIAAFTTSFDTLNAVEVQPDGKIIVAGETNLNFLVARYTATGQLDTTFGTNGVLQTNIHQDIVGSSQDRANCIAIQDDGKIIVGGYAKFFSHYPFAIARYNDDGTLDTSFGLDGITLIGENFDLSSGYKEIYDLAIMPDGKIYAVGESSTSNGATYNNQTIVRYNSNGTLDDTFGSNNGVIYFGLSNNSKFEALQLQDDGKLALVGNLGVKLVVTKLNANGSYDDTFSDDGKDDPTLGASASFGRSISVQPDGKIIATGNMNEAGTSDPQSAIIRYLPNGDLDTTFSNDGILKFLVGDGYQGGSFSALQPDGKLIVGGDYNDSTISNTDLYLYRLTTGILSVDDYELNTNEISIYPNPTSDIVTIELTDQSIAKVTLYDISGKELTQFSGSTIDMSRYKSGIYFISIYTSSEHIISSKIIKS